MQIARLSLVALTMASTSLAHADGFAITQDLSNGAQMRLLEHTAQCNGGPGAFVYRHQKQVDQTCNVRLTPAGATVELPAFEPHMFIPRDTLYPNSND